MKTLCSTVLVAALVACHSATLYVERRASAGTERDHAFTPLRGADQHYIAFPAYPFVNCVDALAAGSALHDELSEEPCWKQAEYTDFVGYQPSELWPGGRATWIDEYADHAQHVDLGHIAALDRGIDCTLSKLSNTPPCRIEAPWPVTQLSFLHFSDVQIREPEAKLGGSSVSARLDPLVPSFERDHDQELFSAFVYSAIVDTVNAELRAYRVADDSLPSDHPSRRARLAPQFMIHTGDAVDAGLQSEFDQFELHSDRLELPWYQAIGNHDALAFGNLRMVDPVRVTTKDDSGEHCAGPRWTGVGCSCTRVANLVREYNLAPPNNRGEPVPVPKQAFTLVPTLLNRLCLLHHVAGDLFVMDPAHYGSTIESFVAAHCRPGLDDAGGRACVAARSDVAYPVHRAGRRCAGLVPGQSGSVLNGFDLGPDRDLPERVRRRVAEQDLSAETEPRSDIGYYCFEIAVSGGDRRAWAIVLNTTTLSGAYGEIQESQLEWLRGVLGELSSRDLVLVFAHHPVWDIFDSQARDDLADILTGHRNIVGYFAGHTHDPELRLIHPPGRHDRDRNYHHVWEIVAPAVISFPQQVRQVTLKVTGDIGYLELLSFSPVGTGESASRIERAQAGARRDYCNEQRTCIGGEPHLPGRTVSFPRLFFKLPQG